MLLVVLIQVSKVSNCDRDEFKPFEGVEAALINLGLGDFDLRRGLIGVPFNQSIMFLEELKPEAKGITLFLFLTFRISGWGSKLLDK